MYKFSANPNKILFFRNHKIVVSAVCKNKHRGSTMMIMKSIKCVKIKICNYDFRISQTCNNNIMMEQIKKVMKLALSLNKHTTKLQ